jgi:hypothetical protein
MPITCSVLLPIRLAPLFLNKRALCVCAVPWNNVVTWSDR